MYIVGTLLNAKLKVCMLFLINCIIYIILNTAKGSIYVVLLLMSVYVEVLHL